jgi:hypothetical protein
VPEWRLQQTSLPGAAKLDGGLGDPAMLRVVVGYFNNELLPYPVICYHFWPTRTLSGHRPGLESGISNQELLGEIE